MSGRINTDHIPWKHKSLSSVKLFSNVFLPASGEGARICGLFVHDGDIVEKGQKLVEIITGDGRTEEIVAPEPGICHNVISKFNSILQPNSLLMTIELISQAQQTIKAQKKNRPNDTLQQIFSQKPSSSSSALPPTSTSPSFQSKSNSDSDLDRLLYQNYENLAQLFRKSQEIDEKIQKMVVAGQLTQADWFKEVKMEVEQRIIECRREVLSFFKQMKLFQKKNYSGYSPFTLKRTISYTVTSFIPRLKIQKEVRREQSVSLSVYSLYGKNENIHNLPSKFYARTTSTYPYMEYKHSREGEPICDHYRVLLTPNYSILALADGCNWGRAPATAARKSLRGFIRHMKKRLTCIYDTNTLAANAVVAIESAHNAIIRGEEQEGRAIGSTTLIGAVVLRLDDSIIGKEIQLNHQISETGEIVESKQKSMLINEPFVVTISNIGDCKGFLFRKATKSIIELTPDSRSENPNDPTDCGGRIGPYINGGPDLRNLSAYYSFCEEDDIVILCTDGVHDNFDPQFRGLLPADLGYEVEGNSWSNLDNASTNICKSEYRCSKLSHLIEDLLNNSFTRKCNPDTEPPHNHQEQMIQGAPLINVPTSTTHSQSERQTKDSDHKEEEEEEEEEEEKETSESVGEQTEKIHSSILSLDDPSFCQKICDMIIHFCIQTAQPSQQFLQQNNGKRLPVDYQQYPGKLDHTSLIAMKISDWKKEELISFSSTKDQRHFYSPSAPPEETKLLESIDYLKERTAPLLKRERLESLRHQKQMERERQFESSTSSTASHQSTVISFPPELDEEFSAMKDERKYSSSNSGSGQPFVAATRVTSHGSRSASEESDDNSKKKREEDNDHPNRDDEEQNLCDEEEEDEEEEDDDEDDDDDDDDDEIALNNNGSTSGIFRSVDRDILSLRDGDTQKKKKKPLQISSLRRSSYTDHEKQQKEEKRAQMIARSSSSSSEPFRRFSISTTMTTSDEVLQLIHMSKEVVLKMNELTKAVMKAISTPRQIDLDDFSLVFKNMYSTVAALIFFTRQQGYIEHSENFKQSTIQLIHFSKIFSLKDQPLEDIVAVKAKWEKIKSIFILNVRALAQEANLIREQLSL